MLWNNLKITLRNLWKNKIFSLINLFGLAIGLACCIILYLYVADELSYDKHNPNHERIYRLGTSFKFNELELTDPSTSPAVGPALVNEFPEVENSVRILREFNPLPIETDGKSFVEEKIYWTDPSFVDIFNVSCLEGNPKLSLSQPNQLVISRSTAMKYFGSLQVMGKQVKLEDDGTYTITSVVEDMPKNSHFHFHFLTSVQTHWKYKVTSWMNDGAYTYVLLDRKSSAESFHSKLPGLVKKYIEPELIKNHNQSLKEYEEAGNYHRYYAMPLSKIHLHSHSIYELEPNGNISNVYIFSFSSLLILLIACINFTNLSTAKSTQRAKEIGVRKTLGSTRKRLIGQFLSESILLSLFALVIALLLVEASLPLTNSLIGKKLQILYHQNYHLLLLFLGIALFTGLFAGSYSAFYLSRFNPMKVMKGDISRGSQNSSLRKVLVGIQFCISIFLFISTFVIRDQMNYIHSKDLGFQKENLLVLDNAHKLQGSTNFKELLQKHPGVKDVSQTTNIPGGFFDGFTVMGDPSTDPNSYSTRAMCTDFDFIKTMGMQVVEGRFFSRDLPSDSKGIVINQTMAKEMNLAQPLGKKIYFNFMEPLTIIGLVKDFHFVSLHNKISSVVMLHPDFSKKNKIAIRFLPEQRQSVLRMATRLWEQHSNGFPLEYFFVADQMEDLHRTENRTMKLFSIFSILSILVTCLGLLGLSSFTTEQRTKEIGIRKTLGASNFTILHLLNRDILSWMIVAFIFTSPIAWYIMNHWLQDFAYRTAIHWYAFALSGGLALLIALLTVSWQAWRASRLNPVEALRYE
ncbi:MAG: ABC transporter permease [Marinifilaceae bacterium]